ncbi:MAG: hypothetical protein ACFB2X_25780 [Rivularia sp. (in: cyanobacteria)]
MSKPGILNSNDSDYVLVYKRLLFANARAYAFCVKHLAAILDENEKNIAQKSAQFAKTEALSIPQDELDSYVQSLIYQENPGLIMTYKNPSSPEESD